MAKAKSYAEQVQDVIASNPVPFGMEGKYAVSGAYGYNDPRVQPGSFASRLATGIGGVGGGGVPGAFQSAYDEAKRANEERYASIDKGYEERVGRVRAILDTMNQSLIEDVNRTWDDQKQAALAPFTKNIGANANSVTAQMLRNNAEGRSSALARARDQIAGTLLRAEDYTKDRLDFQERRNDTYPDAGRMDRLMAAGGEADGGGPGYNSPSPNPAWPWGYGNGYAPRQAARQTGPTLGQLRNAKKANARMQTQVQTAAPLVNNIVNTIKNAPAAIGGALNGFWNNMTPYVPPMPKPRALPAQMQPQGYNPMRPLV